MISPLFPVSITTIIPDRRMVHTAILSIRRHPDQQSGVQSDNCNIDNTDEAQTAAATKRMLQFVFLRRPAIESGSHHGDHKCSGFLASPPSSYLAGICFLPDCHLVLRLGSDGVPLLDRALCPAAAGWQPKDSWSRSASDRDPRRTRCTDD